MKKTAERGLGVGDAIEAGNGVCEVADEERAVEFNVIGRECSKRRAGEGYYERDCLHSYEGGDAESSWGGPVSG